MQSQSKQRILEILAQGPRLSRHAGAQTGDLNEAHMLVHGVISRALRPDREQDDMCSDLSSSLERWRHRNDGRPGRAA